VLHSEKVLSSASIEERGVVGNTLKRRQPYTQ